MAQQLRTSAWLTGFIVALAVLTVAGCGDRVANGLHAEIVALDDVGTPGWRTGPGEAESAKLLAARAVLAAKWFPNGTSKQQAIRTLEHEGYGDVRVYDDGYISGVRYGRGWLCQPSTVVQVMTEKDAVQRAEVMTYPAVTLMGGVIC